MDRYRSICDQVNNGKQKFQLRERKRGVRLPADPSCKKELFVLLLMTIFSQSLLTLMRRNFMTLPLFTTRHTQFFFC